MLGYIISHQNDNWLIGNAAPSQDFHKQPPFANQHAKRRTPELGNAWAEAQGILQRAEPLPLLSVAGAGAVLQPPHCKGFALGRGILMKEFAEAVVTYCFRDSCTRRP